ncbi:hypothetical protein HK097_006447, partial [Rhizophlyctis rosea]
MPTDITFEHTPRSLVSTPLDLSSAPKELEFWAVLDPDRFNGLNLDSETVRNPPLKALASSKPGEPTTPAAALLAVLEFDPKVRDSVTVPVLESGRRVIER